MKQIFVLIATVAFFVLITESCEFSTANLVDPKVCIELNEDLCKQDNPIISADVKQLFASCKIKNAPPETQVKFTWMFYGETKIKIDEVTFNSKDLGTNLNLHSSLNRPFNGWPKGVYEVEMQIVNADKEPLIKQFRIE